MNNNQHMEDDVIDLLELAHVLVRKWWLILVAAILGFGIAAGVTKFAMTPVYESQAMLYILSKTTSVTSVADLQFGAAITEDFAIIAKSKPVIDMAIESIENEHGVRLTRSQVSQMITVSNVSDTRILNIKATGVNPEQACWVANAVAEATANRMAEITKTDPPTTVEKAEVAKRPVGPNLIKNSLMGFLAGAVLVCGILTVQFLLDDSIKTEEDVEKYLGEVTLVVIPNTKGKDNKKQELMDQQRGGKRGKKQS